MSAQPEITHIAADDPTRELTLVGADDPGLLHLGVVGDTYTVLVSGAQTDGHYALIDMLIPPGGGPPPHRHDFEEQFHVLEGEVTVTFRGEQVTAGVGQTVNVPSRAPHSFTNATDQTLRLLCMVSPAGMEEYFAAFGEVVETRTSPAPQLTQEELMAKLAESAPVAARFKIEALPPA